MKLSISLPDEDVEFLDEYARAIGASSRSAIIQKAVQLLRATELSADYAQAWEEWRDAGESEAWETVAEDGLGRNVDNLGSE